MQRVLSTILLLCGLLWSQLASAEATATVNRHNMPLGDVLTLTINLDEQPPVPPDFSPLEREFRIIDTHRILITEHRNGEQYRRTRWSIQMRPRKPGQLTIPRLRLGHSFSQPLMITVDDQGPIVAGSSGTKLFIDDQISRDQVYVNSQILYTARLFYQGVLPDDTYLSPPKAPDSRIERLAPPANYETEYRNDNYRVREVRYAIFPRQEGTLLLDGVRLMKAGDAVLNRVGLEPRNYDVEVYPPAHTSSRNIWIPAHNVSLTETWNPPARMELGDHFIRHITLTAEGVSASQLPELVFEQGEGAFMEVQNVQLDETETPHGITATRTETIRVELTHNGDVTLPPIDINWWNIDRDRAGNASLPARELLVGPVELVKNPPDIPESAVIKAGEQPPVAEEPKTSGRSGMRWVVGLILALMAGLAAYQGYKKWRAKTGSTTLEDTEEHPVMHELPEAEARAFEALERACLSNDPLATQACLILWAEIMWPKHHFESALDLGALLQNTHLDFLLLDLDEQVQSLNPQWQGNTLLPTLHSIRQARARELNATVR